MNTIKKNHAVRFQLWLLLLSFALLLQACKEVPVGPVEPLSAVTKGVYVLNEGNFGSDNSTLTYFSLDSNKATTDFFNLANGRLLGNNANDLKIIDGKMFILVTESSKIEVVNAADGKSITTISLFNGGTPKKPRSIAFAAGKAFVSCYDGTVVVIDLASLAVIQSIPVGAYPEEIAVQNGKVYVTNSGGLNFPDYDSTLSVIDPKTLVESKRFKLRINPTNIAADNYGDIYAVSTGNYGDVPARLIVIDAATDIVKKTFDFDAGSITISGDFGYVISNGKLIRINVKDETIVNETFIAADNFTYFYGVSVDETTGDIFCTDAKDFTARGTVSRFDQNGLKKDSFDAGINPKRVSFFRQ